MVAVLGLKGLDLFACSMDEGKEDVVGGNQGESERGRVEQVGNVT